MSRFESVLSMRPGRKEGVAGMTTGPLSSCQLPRGNTRIGSGVATACVTIVHARPPHRPRTRSASRRVSSKAARSYAVAIRNTVVARMTCAGDRAEAGTRRAATSSTLAASSGSTAASGLTVTLTGTSPAPSTVTTSLSPSRSVIGSTSHAARRRPSVGNGFGSRHSLSTPGTSAPDWWTGRLAVAAPDRSGTGRGCPSAGWIATAIASDLPGIAVSLSASIPAVSTSRPTAVTAGTCGTSSTNCGAPVFAAGLPSTGAGGSAAASSSQPSECEARKVAMPTSHAACAAMVCGAPASRAATAATCCERACSARPSCFLAHGLSTSISGGNGESLLMPLSSGSGVKP